jgi:hypothetical protein
MSTLNDTIPSNQLTLTMDNTSGIFNFLNLQNQQSIIASRPQIDVEFGLVLADGSTEWIPMGTYFLDQWKNDVGALTITMTAHDNLLMLSNKSYGQAGSGAGMTLFDLAVDVLTNSGISNYSVDDNLKQVTTTTGFKDRISSRDALQHIGIAGKSAVFQDRYGVLQVKQFSTLDQSSLYSNYATSQLSFFGYPTSGTMPGNYLTENTDSGMRYIDFDNMYTVPEIILDKSIYQLVIKVYNGSSSVDRVYTNNTIAGTNGESFTIDNPLINSNVQADDVAQWFMNESNYNAVYKSNWRQNPILECADVVIVESGFSDGTNDVVKQTRIYKNEYNYEGYLYGNTESRGGI